MKPAASIIGITHQVKIAPPVKKTSVIFMAASIAIMETRDMLMAVLNANFITICLERIIVSSIMDVIIPLNIANDMMAQTGHGIPVI